MNNDDGINNISRNSFRMAVIRFFTTPTKYDKQATETFSTAQKSFFSELKDPDSPNQPPNITGLF